MKRPAEDRLKLAEQLWNIQHGEPFHPKADKLTDQHLKEVAKNGRKHWDRLKYLTKYKAKGLIQWQIGQKFSGFRKEEEAQVKCPCQGAVLNQMHLLKCNFFFNTLKDSWRQLSDHKIWVTKKNLLKIITPNGLQEGDFQNKMIPKYHLIEKIFTCNIAKKINKHYGDEIFKMKEKKVHDLVRVHRQYIEDMRPENKTKGTKK